jgi:NADPH-dependent 2,4-dienoyl-CoA reductase/sulfur reductase-like enzyme
MHHYDIAVIGAGPAGIAAACLAAKHGATVLLLDEQMRPGGQIYRNIANQTIKNRQILGVDYYKGDNLVQELTTSNVNHVDGATCWQVSGEHEIGYSKDGVAYLVHAEQIIIATGAMERPLPVSGWTLPGVMNAGAAQILLKSSGVTIEDAVFIGTGPLLYLIAYQYFQAGIAIGAILDITPRGNYLKALPHLPAAFADLGGLLKGWGWIRQIRKAGIPLIKGIEDIKLSGKNALERVEYLRKGKWHQIATKSALLHQGVVPNVNLAMACGCKHQWNEAQLCWHAVTDDWAESNIDGIVVTGDGAGIGGALAAETSGRIAALGALCRSGRISQEIRNQTAAPLRRALAREMRIRPFLDTLFQPGDRFRIPMDDATIVCRCEEVTAGTIRQAVADGCLGPNQLKSFTRCGMGPCQGRSCGLTVSEIIAHERDVPVTEAGAFRLRFPIKPLSLGELADLAVEPVFTPLV